MKLSLKSVLFSKGIMPFTSTADIEAISGLNALFVAASASDFVLSGNEIQSWKDRSANNNHILASGVLRIFNASQKKVTNPSINSNTPFTNVINYGTGDYTIVIYENFIYRNGASSFVMDNFNYIGENIGASYLIKEGSSTSTFDKDIVPSGIKKHFIRKTSGSHGWIRNGVSLNRTSNQSSTMTVSTLGTDYGSVCLGDSYAYVFFNRSLSDSELDIVKNNLDQIFG